MKGTYKDEKVRIDYEDNEGLVNIFQPSTQKSIWVKKDKVRYD